jgi:Hint domain
MRNNPQSLSSSGQRTRRNIMKMGAVLASATVARANSAHAVPSVVCVTPAARNFPSCTNCFLKGTKIRTAAGERQVETLAIGNLLPTVFGGLRPIQWIGRYPLKKSDPSKPWVKGVLPVRISRSALAPDVPHTDLYVTAPHSLFLDGFLVPVGDLINGTSITRDECDCDELEFFHIKLESHDIIYAEGLPSTHC